MKIFRLLSLCVLAFSLTADGLNAKRPWLFFVYMAADNSLWQEADVNIAQIVEASKTQNAYIVVYLNIKRNGQKKQSQLFLIQDGQKTQIGATGADDSGDYKTLIKTLSTAVTDFPSDHVLVDLWNHGSGPLNRTMLEHRGVCYDDTTGNYMTDLGYKQALDTIVHQYRGGKKIDIVAFDACLMADLEVDYALAPCANYVVSSQQTVPGPGYNYTLVLQALASTNPTPISFATSIVKDYDAYYKTSGQAYTLSAKDLSKLAPVVSATNALANLLNTLLNNDTTGSVAQALYTAATSSNLPKFDEPTYLDLATLCADIALQSSNAGLNSSDMNKLRFASRTCMTAISRAVIANVRSADLSNAKGMSIYFADVNSGMEPSYLKLYWTQENPAWVNFLNTYLAGMSIS